MTEIIEKKSQLIGKNRKEIYQEIKGHNTDISTGLHILEDLGYIENMDEKGKEFIWILGHNFEV